MCQHIDYHNCFMKSLTSHNRVYCENNKPYFRTVSLHIQLLHLLSRLCPIRLLLIFVGLIYHCKGSSFTKLKFNNFNKMIICYNFNIEVFILVDLTYLSWFGQPTLAFHNDLPFKIITRLH